ncbi:MAG: DUF4129 domain-containing protein [Stenotrophomonas sp.]
MRIEHLQLVLRPRSGFQAADLGMGLVRANARVVWLAWLAVVLPLAIVLNLAGWYLDKLWLAGVLLWWLKPVFERIPLYVISRAAFGEQVSVGQALRAQAGFGLGSLPAYLLWRRFGLARSLMMPVDMLEGGPASLRRQRRNALLGDYGMAALVTWLMFHIELLLILGIVALSGLMLPPDMLGDAARELWEIIRSGDNTYSSLAMNVLEVIAMCVIGPLYVGAGFGLYLDARTRREAWDIELGLRRLRQRLQVLHQPLSAALLAVGLGLLLVASPLARAGDAVQADATSKVVSDVDGPGPMKQTVAQPTTASNASPASQQAFSRAVNQAYAHPDFGQQRQRTERLGNEKKPAQAGSRKKSGRIAEMIGAVLANIGSLVLYALLAVVLVLIVLAARRWLPWLRWRRTALTETAIEQHALSLPDTLPDGIAERAQQLWQQGHGRQAMALLYRGSVAALDRLGQQPLPAGATEAQCLRAARQLPEASQRELFADTVRSWQQTAWAGQLPSEAGFAQLLQRLRQQPGWLQ